MGLILVVLDTPRGAMRSSTVHTAVGGRRNPHQLTAMNVRTTAVGIVRGGNVNRKKMSTVIGSVLIITSVAACGSSSKSTSSSTLPSKNGGTGTTVRATGTPVKVMGIL